MGDAFDAGTFPAFDRRFFESSEDFTVICGGEIGGKAHGLAAAKSIIETACPADWIPGMTVSIPRLAVLATDAFEQFMTQNELYGVAESGEPDARIAHAFLRAELPPLIVGDLRALIARTHTPLAVRSSSLLEDALNHPFAGVYATKMIPNHQPSAADRFRKLGEAIKFVWASTFFADARQYMRVIDRPSGDERMAVIIQEVVGERFDERYYPIVSGVIRTHNYYPTGPARPEDGVVNLALGLGKTIVDGGVTWAYSPRYPRLRPPYGSVGELLENSQTRLWAVNMGAAPYNPMIEEEYLVENGLDVAEWDDVLRFTASTYDAASDRLNIGTGRPGPRVLTFGRMLELEDVPLNRVVVRLSEGCKDALKADVEIEFAMTLDRMQGLPARFGFLQVRPMAVAGEQIEVSDAELQSDRAIVTCTSVLGNGENDAIADVVYVRPETFDAAHTNAIARELEPFNRRLVSARRPYVLIGFGRWGSSDPWLGIPATWPQISGARVIVEATLPEMHVDASQGSHFFHNMISFQVKYFTVRHTGRDRIDWGWLERQPVESETSFVRHVRLPSPMRVRVDGRHGRGVILHD
jgi:hypothetical protein